MGFPPQQGYPGAPGKDPRMVVALAVVAVAALVGVAILGFVSPGFFLGDDESSADGGGKAGAPTGTSTSASGREGSLPTATSSAPVDMAQGKELVHRFIDGINAHDRSGVESATCADFDDGQAVTAMLDQPNPVLILGPDTLARVTEQTYDLEFTGIEDNEPVSGIVGALNPHGTGWCIDTFSYS